MTKSGTGSRLCAAVAVTLIVMPAFGSAAFAQQSRPSPPSWHGTFEWTHVCSGPPGFGIKTRGVGNLELYYSESGSVDANGDARPDRTLNGRLAGTTPENLPSAPGCSITMLAPGTFSASVAGSYTPTQNTFSAYAYRVNSTPGRNSHACHGASHVGDAPFFVVIAGPIFEDAFRELRRQPDGSLKSSGERTTGAGCITTYSLTLHGCGSNMPENGMIYAAPGRNPRLHSAPSADSSILSVLLSGQRVRYTQTTQVNGQTWFFIDRFGQKGWAPAGDFSCGLPVRPPAPKLILDPKYMYLYEGTAALASAGRG